MGNTTKRTSARDEAHAYAKWLSVQDDPWMAPPTLEAALRKVEAEPAIWLNRAVDVMAFGNDAGASDPMEFAARRCQASRALCEAARTGHVKMIGSPNQPGDLSDPIPRAYFDTPRQLGSKDNSLETNLDAVSDDEFTVATSGGHQKWFSVRAETNSLVLWLRGFVSARGLELPVEEYMIEPISKPGIQGYAPLSSALLWIMTDGGSSRKSLHDCEAWDRAAERLIPLISTGQIQVVGRPTTGGTPEVILGSTFSGILIDRPLSGVTKLVTRNNPWIWSAVYAGNESWRDGGLNDQMFTHQGISASWTHLEVKKEDVLRWFPFLGSPVKQPPQRRGAPPQYDWDDGKQFVFKELETYGDFDLPENHSTGWRSQNDLIDRLLEYMGRRSKEPGRSTAQGYVSTWVSEWRKSPNNSAT